MWGSVNLERILRWVGVILIVIGVVAEVLNLGYLPNTNSFAQVFNLVVGPLGSLFSGVLTLGVAEVLRRIGDRRPGT